MKSDFLSSFRAPGTFDRYDDDEEEEIAALPPVKRMLPSPPPVKKGGGGTKPLPPSVYFALEALVDDDNQGSYMSEDSFRELSQVYNNSKPDLNLADPPIVLLDSIPLGSGCDLFVNEIVPISVFLLLLHFKCVFKIEPLMRVPKSFSTVYYEPFRGERLKKAATFGAERILEAECASLELDYQTVRSTMETYMKTQLGKTLNTEDVASDIFIQSQLERMNQHLKLF